MIGQLCFHPLVLSDREAIQAVTLNSWRRNCNYTFANIIGWQFWYIRALDKDIQNLIPWF